MATNKRISYKININDRQQIFDELSLNFKDFYLFI